MKDNLDDLLAALGRTPLDQQLGRVADDVGQRVAETRAATTQTWGIRAGAMLLVATSGIAISAVSTAAAAPDPSPFAAWSTLAPSTLLE